ncbi:MAG: hypothetical protein AAGA11_07140 [Pseudomonadota bacterium]
MVLDDAATQQDIDAGYTHLVDACARLRGFPCRVLAKHIESGDFGSPDPARVARLLEQACEGGDTDGCGRPETAIETFH